MKKKLIWLLSLLTITVLAESDNLPVKKGFHRTYLSANFGYATLDLPVGSYSDPGASFAVGYFFIPKLALDAHYFLTPSATGASNLNGFGLRGRYYFWNSEVTSFVEYQDSRVTTYDKFFGYVSLGFLDREVRTSSLSISYSGFGVSVGAGMKLDERSSIGVDLQRTKLENPSGSVIKEGADLNYLSVYYSYFF
ncbi:MAG: porin family protein [Bacteriovoracaceae bacterium]|nr:porin family protein [Bacteriovoracaceae bacterium]